MFHTFVLTAALLIQRPYAALAQTDALPPLCYGDCEQNEVVDISDLVLLVNITLGSQPVSACSGISETPEIDDLIRAVNTALTQCPIPITYRLTDASTIIVSDGSGSPPNPQPLAGQFTVVVSTDPPPNTLIGLTLMRIDFSAPGISVKEGELTNSGCSDPHELAYGCINADTINSPPVAFASAFLSINSHFSVLTGAGPYKGNPNIPYNGSTPPPPFHDLTLCSSAVCDNIRNGVTTGYIFTLFGIPDIR